MKIIKEKLDGEIHLQIPPLKLPCRSWMPFMDLQADREEQGKGNFNLPVLALCELQAKRKTKQKRTTYTAKIV